MVSANKACPPGRVMAVSYTATPSRWADLNGRWVKDVGGAGTATSGSPGAINQGWGHLREGARGACTALPCRRCPRQHGGGRVSGAGTAPLAAPEGGKRRGRADAMHHARGAPDCVKQRPHAPFSRLVKTNKKHYFQSCVSFRVPRFSTCKWCRFPTLGAPF